MRVLFRSLKYFEETSGGIPLYPADAFGRARARQVINIAQVYIEAPLRSLFPGVFMGGVNDPATIATVRPLVERAMRALSRLTSFHPFIQIGRASCRERVCHYV